MSNFEIRPAAVPATVKAVPAGVRQTRAAAPTAIASAVAANRPRAGKPEHLLSILINADRRTAQSRVLGPLCRTVRKNGPDSLDDRLCLASIGTACGVADLLGIRSSQCSRRVDRKRAWPHSAGDHFSRCCTKRVHILPYRRHGTTGNSLLVRDSEQSAERIRDKGLQSIAAGFVFGNGRTS